MDADRFNFDAAAVRQIEKIRRIGMRKLRDRSQIDDFVQETLLRAYVNRDQLRDAAKFDGWIAVIALNLAREWNQTFERRKRDEPLDDQPELIDWRTPHDAVEEADRAARLRQAMARLRPDERELLRARYLEDASYADLQARYGLSYSAVALRIHRAKKRLRRLLKATGAALAVVFTGFRRAAWGGVLLVTNTTKIAVGVGLAGAVIAAWLLFMNGGEKADSGSATDAVQSPRLGDSPLKLEDQTPRFIPEPTEKASGAVESPPSEAPGVKSVKPPVELLSWDDTHAEIARLVGIEYDALIQILPKLKAMDGSVNAAYEKVINGVDPQYDYLREAIAKFQDHGRLNSIYDPRYPASYDFDPRVLLVRSGRLDPDEMPHQKRTLANGQVIRMLPHEKYIIKKRHRRVYSEDQLQLKETLQQKQTDLQARLSGASSESEAQSLRSELEEIQKGLEGFPPFIETREVWMWGREDDPNLKVYEIDLGFVE